MKNSGRSSNRPKNQHWVPRFYLRQFATPETRERDEAQIWMFSNQDRDTDECLTNIKNVCCRRHLYSPMNDSGQRDWALEEQLADLFRSASRSGSPPDPPRRRRIRRASAQRRLQV